MNELERAVIEAAYALNASWKATIERVTAETAGRTQQCIDALSAAVEALDAAGATGEREVPWTQVAEGDQLRSPVNGQFYPITATQATQRGQVRVTVRIGTISKTITRPIEREPMAYIRRGETGQAIETFLCVLSSGGPRRAGKR